jgi:hypothetical protein
MTTLLLLAYLAIPPKPQACLINGKNGFEGQTLVVDKKCASGLRWKTEK